jgi:hypothetical protein
MTMRAITADTVPWPRVACVGTKIVFMVVVASCMRVRARACQFRVWSGGADLGDP